MRTLKRRVAVVTGAASGIGRALAMRLADEECGLALVDRDGAGLERLRDELRLRARSLSVHALDVSDRAALARLPEEVVEAHGHVHILVNNAGVALSGTLVDNSIEDLDWIVDINFWGVVLACKHFIPWLARGDEGHIVNLSSLFGLVGLPSVGAYCATKAAVRSYSETLGAELHGTGITVTSVHPGGVSTNIMRHARLANEADRTELVALFDRLRTQPDRAAARIVEAIRHGRTRLRIGPETYVSDWLRRLAPVTVNRVVARVWTRAEARRRAAAIPESTDRTG
jgi:short-subunit dehydrogenase